MGVSGVLALLLGAIAPGGEAPERINLTPPGCAADTAADATVCGQRGPSYRIDPDVLAADRAHDAPGESRPALDVRTATRGCRTSTKGCEDSGALPVSAVALALAKAGLLALQGEDWREPFRTGPDEYQRYQAARARARPRVSVGVGASARSGTGERP